MAILFSFPVPMDEAIMTNPAPQTNAPIVVRLLSQDFKIFLTAQTITPLLTPLFRGVA